MALLRVLAGASTLAALLLGGAVAQPACPNLSVRLKASKQVALGGSAHATAVVRNGAWGSDVSNVVVSITLPPNFQKPIRVKSMPKAYLGQALTYNAPSVVWAGVTIPRGKQLRLSIRSKLDKCQAGAASLDFIAAAYIVDSANNIVCLSQPAGPATIKVKALNAKQAQLVAPCPGSGSGPQGSSLLAENQAFSGSSDPNNNRRGRRHLAEEASLDACIASCGNVLDKPYYVAYNANTGACSCCKDACGALVPSTGTNTYFVPIPAPGPAPAPVPPSPTPPSPSPPSPTPPSPTPPSPTPETPAPTIQATPAPTNGGGGESYILCKENNRCGGNEIYQINTIDACVTQCVGKGADYKTMSYQATTKVCRCAILTSGCSTVTGWNSYPVQGGTCPAGR